MTKSPWLPAACIAVTVSGCSAGSATPRRGPGSTDPNGTGNSGGNGNGAGGEGFIGTGTDPMASGGDVGNVDPNNPDACQGISEQAEKVRGGKADIVWILDNSGSMFEEAAGVSQNLNNFSKFITGTGVDVHVVFVSFGLGDPIGPPLSTGQDFPNDSNPPTFLHVPPAGGDAFIGVQSHDLLAQLQQTYDSWKASIRPDATKTIVIVTDDENDPAPTGPEFKADFDKKFAGSLWRFSGVFCYSATGQLGDNCAGNGATYKELVDQTGGVWADLGAPSPDWSKILQELADAVVADAKPVDCAWTIPAAPDGQTFDRNKVNVMFTPSTGAAEPLYGVGDPSQCTDKYLGWTYDDPNAPKQIIACPQSCTILQADDAARIDVKLGCKTEQPPIM